MFCRPCVMHSLPISPPEMWTLRGARVSVSTFQRENFFGYKLAPALDGSLFPTFWLSCCPQLPFLCREFVSCRRRPRARGTTSAQCSGWFTRLTLHIIGRLTFLQELVNLAPFVLDDGSIVTGQCCISSSRVQLPIRCRHQII